MPRVQVVLSEEERDRFRGQARREGLPLSAWLRAAGQDRLAKACERPRMQTTEALDAFFQQCDERGESGKRARLGRALEGYRIVSAFGRLRFMIFVDTNVIMYAVNGAD